MQGYWESIFGEQKNIGAVADAWLSMIVTALITALIGTLIGAAFGFGWACLGLVTGGAAGGLAGLDRHSDHSLLARLGGLNPPTVKLKLIYSFSAFAMMAGFLLVCGMASLPDSPVSLLVTAVVSAGFMAVARWLRESASKDISDLWFGMITWAISMTALFYAITWIANSVPIAFGAIFALNVLMLFAGHLDD
jgi:hypothetical protein